MAQLTRSQHPDLRLFTQVPGKIAWLSNRSYKTQDGAEVHMYNVARSGGNRRGVEYKVVFCTDNKYRVLAKPVGKISSEVSK